MKPLKVHYHGVRDARAYCGATTTADKLTRKVADVTCKLCLRHIAGGLRKPLKERKEGRRVTTTTTKTHWAHLDHDTPACGEPSRSAKVTHEQDAITCGRCLRLLGIEVDASGKVPEYLKNDPLHTAISQRAMNSLLGRAFNEAEGEMAVALVEAEKALAESLKCKDPGEIIAELSGALRRLVDLLGSKTSM